MFFREGSCKVSPVLSDTRSEEAYTVTAVFINYIGTGTAHLCVNRTTTARIFDNSILIASPSYHGREGILTANLTEQIPQGPYFMSTTTGALYQAFRLYTDHQLAFTQPALPDGEGGFMPLPAVTEVYPSANL